MARRLRTLPGPNSLVETTTRTLQGRFLLRPSDDVNKTIIGVIGRALDMFDGVLLHCVTVMSSHCHLLVTARDSEALSSFMCFVNGNIARKVGKLQGWTNSLWARRYVPIPILDDLAAVQRLHYHLAHGVKEKLVPRCASWPGVNSARALSEGEPLVGIWHDEAADYEARRRGHEPKPGEFDREYVVRLTPLPCWSGLSTEEQQARARKIIDDIEQNARDEVGLPTDDEAISIQQAAILSRDPHHRPDRVSHTPAPLCHTSCRERLKRYRDLYGEFLVAYRNHGDRARRRISRFALKPMAFGPYLGYVPVASPPSVAAPAAPV